MLGSCPKGGKWAPCSPSGSGNDCDCDGNEPLAEADLETPCCVCLRGFVLSCSFLLCPLFDADLPVSRSISNEKTTFSQWLSSFAIDSATFFCSAGGLGFTTSARMSSFERFPVATLLLLAPLGLEDSPAVASISTRVRQAHGRYIT